MKNVYLFRLRRLCAFIIGVVFVIAGIFKLLDPVGAGLVMEGYLRFFHLQRQEPWPSPSWRRFSGRP